MAKITLGIVCHCNENEINDIKNYIETIGGDVVIIKQSWGKLWIKDGDAP